MTITRLRRLRHSWLSQLLFLVIAAGLVMATSVRGAPHSHHDDGLGQVHHTLLAIDHGTPDAPSDDEPAPVSTHFHYSASLAVISGESSISAAILQPSTVLRPSVELAPPGRDTEIRHRPPIV